MLQECVPEYINEQLDHTLGEFRETWFVSMKHDDDEVHCFELSNLAHHLLDVIFVSSGRVRHSLSVTHSDFAAVPEEVVVTVVRL